MGNLIAWIKKDGHRFEIVVDGVKAWKWKEGEIKDIREVLVVEEVFKDARRGDLAKRDLLIKYFGTEDPIEIAKVILKKGEVPVPTEYRRELIERKRRAVINYISQNAIDPRTKLPIPPSRIENAMEKAKVRIDPNLPIEKIVEEVVEKIRPILPIKFEKKKVKIIIPAKYSPKVYGYLKKFRIEKERWLEDGSLLCIVEIPAGISGEFISNLSKMTSGEVKVVEDG